MTAPAWTAVATSAAVGPRGRMRVTFDGEEYVLWRSAEGRARLFSNRCPHRGMRLSFGFVRRETLICPYHGWTYGADGRCVSIPAHPALTPPATIRVSVPALRERAGLIFAAPAGTSGEPVGHPGAEAFEACRSIYVDVDVAALSAALLLDRPAGWLVGAGSVLWLAGEAPGGGSFEALVALQPLGAARSAAHASVACRSPETRWAFARWLTACRDALSRRAA